MARGEETPVKNRRRSSIARRQSPSKTPSPVSKSTTRRKSASRDVSVSPIKKTNAKSASKRTASPVKSTRKSITNTPTRPSRSTSKSRNTNANHSSEEESDDEKVTNNQIKMKLTTTPRRYPLLNKDIDVSDRLIDKKTGELKVKNLTSMTNNTSSSTRKSLMPSTSPLSSSHYIQPIPGSALYHPQNKSKLLQDFEASIQNNGNTYKSSPNLLLRGLLLIVLLASAIGGIYLLFNAMPPIEEGDKIHVKLPRSIEEAKSLSVVVDKYKDQYPIYVFSLFAATYIFLQAFAIPGAVLLSVLAGPIWGVVKGIFVISIVATTGSSLCFLISKTIARPIFERFFPQRIIQFKTQLDQNRDNLFFYLLFLRIAPVFPNWLITISSPIIDVPYIHFAVATFIGIMPNNYLMTTVGSGLQNMTNNSKLMTPQAILGLFGISLVAILPIVAKKLFEGKKTVAK